MCHCLHNRYQSGKNKYQIDCCLDYLVNLWLYQKLYNKGNDAYVSTGHFGALAYIVSLPGISPPLITWVTYTLL